MTGCSTLHMPNSGFEESLAGGGGRGQLIAGLGNTQSLNFNEFENSEDKDQVRTFEVGNLLLSGAIRVAENFEVNLSSFSTIPFPSIVGAKYQFVGVSAQTESLSAAISLRVAYTTFSNRGGYSPIGACTGNSNCAVDDPNGRYVAGNLWAYILGFPIGYQVNERWRLILSPQITYFDGRYVLFKKATLTDTEYLEEKHGLSGLRKTLSIGGSYQISPSWLIVGSAQAHEYTWSDFARTQNASVYLGLSHVFGKPNN